MSVVLTINGQNFDYPTTGDEEWGPEATDWASAVSTGLLQKTGGLFQLLAEVDFGPTYGLKSAYLKTETANPASAGVLRLARVDSFGWRNQANSADLLFSVNNLNQLLFDGNPLIGFLTPLDTDSIDMDITAGLVSANLNLSADAADPSTQLVDLTIETDGLKAQITNAAIFAALPNASAGQTGLLTNTDWSTFNNKQAAGNYITALTGDGTAAGPGSVPLTLANVNADVGSFLGTNLTVNAKGLITAASSSKSSSYELLNLGLSTSVGSDLLTVALKQADGSTDPASGIGTVRIGFRSSTLTSGLYNLRTVTSALSINTVATGASFGTASGQNQYIYIYAIDNAGTVELALAGNMLFDEGQLYSTTAIGGTSNSNQVLYSTTARSNVPVRLIGRILNNQTVAGTYGNAPTQLAVVPFDNTPPRSQVWVTGANGYGSTNTKIRRFSTTQTNYGTGITYADSATLGGSFTINEDGGYSITYTDIFTSSAYMGISLNSNQLTTNINTISIGNQLALQATLNANIGGGCSASFVGTAGDVVRAHSEGIAVGAVGATPMFRITKLSN